MPLGFRMRAGQLLWHPPPAKCRRSNLLTQPFVCNVLQMRWPVAPSTGVCGWTASRICLSCQIKLNPIHYNASVMQELWLKDNRLAALPEELGACTKLKRLWLDDNRLQALPASITALVALQELYAPHNRLRSLPAGLAQMPALRKLCA